MFRLREGLHAFVKNDHCHKSHFDYLELGVYDGYSLRLSIHMNTRPESRFSNLIFHFRAVGEVDHIPTAFMIAESLLSVGFRY